VIPVEVTQTSWHFTTLLDLLDHWQTLFAGALAVLAAWRTIRATTESADREVKASQDQTAVAQRQIETAVRLEQDRAASEVDTLRKSLAIEFRLHVATALVAYNGLHGLGFMPNAPITKMMVEDKSRMAAPIIYPANAGKIALLGAEATDVMIVYDLLEDARDRAERLGFRALDTDDIAPVEVLKAADAFLAACSYARGVLPRLRTGVVSHDDTDGVLVQKINDAFAARPT
jgi:hypothetical protein